MKLRPRQQQVLTLLAQGLTDKQIAAALHVTADTVHEYIKDIYSELGVHNRAACVAEAFRLGLLPFDFPFQSSNISTATKSPKQGVQTSQHLQFNEGDERVKNREKR